MSSNVQTIANLTKLLGIRETADILRLSKKADVIERKWQAEMKAYIREITREVIANAEETGRLRLDFVDFVPIIMELSRAASLSGIESTKTVTPVRAQRLSLVPKGSQPQSFRDLRIWWDAYRKRKKVPQRQQAIADKLRKAYVDRCQITWRENAKDFLSGNTGSKTQAVQAIMDGADVIYGRGKMIVETETTYYFNAARRKIYDQSQDVTHYLFVSIRDHATTKWCKSRQGLVYAKGDQLLNDETPPIHWNCRSEMLPLTPANPNHLKLIQEKARARRNNTPEPLPKEWTAKVR